VTALRPLQLALRARNVIGDRPFRSLAEYVLTLEDDEGHWRRLTIEVRPSLRHVVQARGRFNKLPEPRDLTALSAWAGRNSLQLLLGRW